LNLNNIYTIKTKPETDPLGLIYANFRHFNHRLIGKTIRLAGSPSRIGETTLPRELQNTPRFKNGTYVFGLRQTHFSKNVLFASRRQNPQQSLALWLVS